MNVAEKRRFVASGKNKTEEDQEPLDAAADIAKARRNVLWDRARELLAYVGSDGIDSQRGIKWQCEGSLLVRKFLGLKLNEATPDYSSLTRIRDGYPIELIRRVSLFVPQLAAEKKLVSNPAVGDEIDRSS